MYLIYNLLQSRAREEWTWDSALIDCNKWMKAGSLRLSKIDVSRDGKICI
jgi:hypothetical protein